MVMIGDGINEVMYEWKTDYTKFKTDKAECPICLDEDYPEPSELQFLVQRNEEEREWSLLEQDRLERMVPRPVVVHEMGIAGRTRSSSRPTRQLAPSGTSPGTQRRGGVGRSLSSPSLRSSRRSLPSVRECIGPTRLSRRAQQLERTEGESELLQQIWQVFKGLETGAMIQTGRVLIMYDVSRDFY